MCCMLTLFGWTLDFIQRCWTFTMACIISSAVCCSLITACTSGVALGYNYSLSEYVDLKETNVSIYLKRGIFDDDISDDTKYRRSNGMPIQGHIKDENLMVGDLDEPTTLRSGRRLEDSIAESGDKNNFEDSLMKLTAKPPDYSSTALPNERWVSKKDTESAPNELEHFKEAKGLLDRRRIQAAATRTSPAGDTKTTQYQDIKIVPNFPYGSYPVGINARRMPVEWTSPVAYFTKEGTSLRDAVPGRVISDPMTWLNANLPAHMHPSHMRISGESPTYPSPITPRPAPVRPTRPINIKPKTKSTKPPTTQSPVEVPKSIDEEMDTFKEKFLLGKEDIARDKDKQFTRNQGIGKGPDEDYEDEVKGIPVRKRRSIFKTG